MHFDKKAQDWDSDPTKTIRAIAFAKEIKSFIPTTERKEALEFGCGTGLLSFQLKDFFQTITLADHSEGMIKVLEKKIKAQEINNFKPLLISNYEEELPENHFDVIYTLMTLHHIQNIETILKVFNQTLKTKGYLCIADLVSEDGSFHSQFPDFDGHQGFDKEELSSLLAKNGFDVGFYKITYTIERKTEDKIKKYPLFLLIARKKSD